MKLILKKLKLMRLLKLKLKLKSHLRKNQNHFILIKLVVVADTGGILQILNLKTGQIKKYYSLKRCLNKEDALALKEKNSILQSQNKSITKKVRLKV